MCAGLVSVQGFTLAATELGVGGADTVSLAGFAEQRLERAAIANLGERLYC